MEREREREYTYSYSKKYTYSYSLRVSVGFFYRSSLVCVYVMFFHFVCILCMICPMKQIINLDSKCIDSYSKKKKKKKVHRFLQYEMEEKND